MKTKYHFLRNFCLLLPWLFCQAVSTQALATEALPSCRLLIAKQLFDGVNYPQTNMAVLIEGNKIKQVGTPESLRGQCRNKINLGDATIMPGFIESHAHVTFQNVRKDNVLEHGITTVQDTGGPLQPKEGGQGKLRLLSTGPIIQAVGGYPLNIFTPDDTVGGLNKIGITVATATEAEMVVQQLVDGGATAIKIALEPGGETGAPWMQPHGDHPIPPAPWSILPKEIVQAIVNKAHKLGKRVIAHVGEQDGFDRALAAGVDELAHMPCGEISDASLQAAVKAGITFVTTIDTLASCAPTGLHSNTFRLGLFGANFIYGSEVAHDNVPWGINGEEMHMMLHLTHGADDINFDDVVNIFKSVTSKAGKRLGVHPLLGTLAPGAPADVIAVRGNPFERFKILEYPDFVMSGGRVVVNKF
jgi:imidazolonepropionase-like amidohydrolase